MTDSLTTAIAAAVEAVAAVEDPVERFEAARKIRALLADGDRALMHLQKSVVLDRRPGRTWAEVGEPLGISGSRAEAIAKGR